MAITKIKVEETEISVILEMSGDDYICLTDMARFKDNDSALVISHWMRNLNTIEYLGVWETLHNPNFKPTEFGRFKTEAGYNSFTMSPPKWIKSTEADILNLALFGCTAKDWEEANPLSAQKGMNIRDTATINQLVVMANLESMNAELIKRNMDRTKRLKILRKMAQEQLVSLNAHNAEHKFQKILTAPLEGLVQRKKE